MTTDLTGAGQPDLITLLQHVLECTAQGSDTIGSSYHKRVQGNRADQWLMFRLLKHLVKLIYEHVGVIRR